MCDHPTIVLGATPDDADDATVQYDLDAYLVPMTIDAALAGSGRGITATRIVATIPAQIEPRYDEALTELEPCLWHDPDCRWTRPKDGPR